MTAHDRREPRLPEPAEALLDGWPAPPRGALEWEDAATRTMRRIAETAPGSTDSALLEAPLPRDSSDGELEQELDEAPALASIARAVVAASSEEAARSVAKEMLAAATENRSRPPAPPASRIEAGYSAVNPRRSEPEIVQATHEAKAHSEVPRSTPERKRGGLGFIALGGGGALALAAAAALYVSTRGTPAPTQALEASAEAPAAALAKAPPPAGNAAPPAAEPAAPRPLALDDLQAPGSPRAAAKEGAASTHSAAAAPPPNAKDGLAFRMKGAKSADEKLVLEEQTESEPSAANAPVEKKKAEAPAQAADLPPEPGLGAVQAAIGSVMSGARSCLAGQESGTKATVLFGSNGHVQNVTLSGPAAGTPAESCVRSALMGARVPPFSEPVFSASITVRPP